MQESEQHVGCCLNLRRSDLLLMPLPMFELIHLGAYNVELLVTYIRVMSFLDLDLIMSKQVSSDLCNQSCLNSTSGKRDILI